MTDHSGQESLFGSDAFVREAPSGGSSPSAPLTQSRAFEAYVSAPLDEAQSELEFGGPSAEDFAAYASAEPLVAPAPAELRPRDAGAELEALEQASVVVEDVRRPRALAGSTLDDAMSGAWERLASGLSSACLVCDGEVVASYAGSLHGSCTTCGAVIE